MPRASKLTKRLKTTSKNTRCNNRAASFSYMFISYHNRKAEELEIFTFKHGQRSVRPIPFHDQIELLRLNKSVAQENETMYPPDMKGNRFELSTVIKQNSFAIGTLFMILCAEIAPWIGAQEGPLHPEITVKYLAVALIFFISGLTLEAREFSDALRCFKLHIFIQTFSFFITPLIIQVFLFLFVQPFGLNSWILKGIITVGCMPPPVSSAVVLTRAVGGNEAAAIFNSAVGTFLGIILTPVLLLLHVGLASTLPVVSIIVQIVQTVILPVLIGQLTRLTVNRNLLSKIPFSFIGQLALLFIIYTSFCDLFTQNDFTIDAHHILLTIFLVAVIQMILIFLSFKVSAFLSKRKRIYTTEDLIAITFCSTHKSLTLGMPLLKTLYSGYSHLSQISLPLLVYHPIQLILGGLLVPYGQKLISKRTVLFTRP